MVCPQEARHAPHFSVPEQAWRKVVRLSYAATNDTCRYKARRTHL